MVVDDVTITCDSPAGTAGASVDVVVSNANGTATLAAGFSYHVEPTLTQVNPVAGTSLGGTPCCRLPRGGARRLGCG